MFLLGLTNVLLLSQTLLHDGEIVANLLLDRLLDVFALRDALLKVIVEFGDLVLETVLQVTHGLLVFCCLFNYSILKVASPITDQLPHFIINCLLKLQLIS